MTNLYITDMTEYYLRCSLRYLYYKRLYSERLGKDLVRIPALLPMHIALVLIHVVSAFQIKGFGARVLLQNRQHDLVHLKLQGWVSLRCRTIRYSMQKSMVSQTWEFGRVFVCVHLKRSISNQTHLAEIKTRYI